MSTPFTPFVVKVKRNNRVGYIYELHDGYQDYVIPLLVKFSTKLYNTDKNVLFDPLFDISDNIYGESTSLDFVYQHYYEMTITDFTKEEPYNKYENCLLIKIEYQLDNFNIEFRYVLEEENLSKDKGNINISQSFFKYKNDKLIGIVNKEDIELILDTGIFWLIKEIPKYIKKYNYIIKNEYDQYEITYTPKLD